MRDTAIFDLIAQEHKRQDESLELIASENYCSAQVMEATGSILTWKYAEGYPTHRYYGGCRYIDEVETLARERACRLFGADHANVQPHSGSQANMAAYAALLQPGDTILSAHLNAYGHLTHSSPVSFVSKMYHVVTYDVDANGMYDYDAIRALALEHKPRLILAGASACPREIRFDIFRQIADEVGAYFMVDMAHIAGLVAAGQHMSPIPYADIVTTTTHKTLRGPRGGMILCKEQYAKAVDKAVFPMNQGGPLEHVIAAKAVCFEEALQPEFAEYQAQIVKNAQVLAQTLIENGIPLVSGGTDNHLMLLDLRGTNVTGAEAEKLLEEAHITTNKNMIPNDPLKPSQTSGLRVGTPAVTTRGMKETEMHLIGNCIAGLLKGTLTTEAVREQIMSLCAAFPIPD